MLLVAAWCVGEKAEQGGKSFGGGDAAVAASLPVQWMEEVQKQLPAACRRSWPRRARCGCPLGETRGVGWGWGPSSTVATGGKYYDEMT